MPRRPARVLPFVMRRDRARRAYDPGELDVEGIIEDLLDRALRLRTRRRRSGTEESSTNQSDPAEEGGRPWKNESS